MQPDDDTVRTGNQAAEDVMTAMLEAGQIPGMGWHGDQVPQDIAPGSALLVHRVPRYQAEGGQQSGALLALWLMRHLPPGAQGSVMLAFDGWADDRRPLCGVPCVVDFCRGLLGGAGDRLNPAWARNVLPLMLDERQLPMPMGLEAAGGLWLVAHAYSPEVFHTQPHLLRDMEMNLALYATLLGEL